MAPSARASVPPLAPPSPTDLPSPTDELIPQTTPGMAFAIPETSPEPSPWPDPLDEASPSPMPSEPADAAPAPSAARRTSSPASSASPFSTETIRDTARKIVLNAGATAHEGLCRDAIDEQLGRWATDETDAELIGDPLSRIAQRRLGDVGELGNPDVGDLIAAGIGLALYAWRQMRLTMTARALRKRAHDLEQTADTATEAAGY